MVVKTEKCAFSEYPIFPGHGMKFVRKDGQPIILSGSKSKSLYLQRMKSSKLMWTQAWRRLNKKGNDATVKTKRSKRTVKLQRAIVGVSLEAVRLYKNKMPVLCFLKFELWCAGRKNFSLERKRIGAHSFAVVPRVPLNARWNGCDNKFRMPSPKADRWHIEKISAATIWNEGGRWGGRRKICDTLCLSISTKKKKRNTHHAQLPILNQLCHRRVRRLRR
jgi:large subunit ribosomal protein L24e